MHHFRLTLPRSPRWKDIGPLSDILLRRLRGSLKYPRWLIYKDLNYPDHHGSINKILKKESELRIRLKDVIVFGMLVESNNFLCQFVTCS